MNKEELSETISEELKLNLLNQDYFRILDSWEIFNLYYKLQIELFKELDK